MTERVDSSISRLFATLGAEICYTTEGSIPTLDSALCAEPVTVRKSCVINVKAFKGDLHPSETNSIVVDFRDSEGRGPVQALSITGIEDSFSVTVPAHPDLAGREASTFRVTKAPEEDSGLADLWLSLKGDRVRFFILTPAGETIVVLEESIASDHIHLGLVCV